MADSGTAGEELRCGGVEVGTGSGGVVPPAASLQRQNASVQMAKCQDAALVIVASVVSGVCGAERALAGPIETQKSMGRPGLGIRAVAQ